MTDNENKETVKITPQLVDQILESASKPITRENIVDWLERIELCIRRRINTPRGKTIPIEEDFLIGIAEDINRLIGEIKNDS